MPDNADDGRRYLWTPGWVWDAIFKILQLAVVAYFGNSAVNSIRDNGADNKVHADAQVVAIKENTAVVERNAVATENVPVAAVAAAKVLVEQKASDAKAADDNGPSPNGLEADQ